jgi:hypothetical protein
MDVGMVVPVKAFFSKHTILKFTRLPMDGGIVPVANESKEGRGEFSRIAEDENKRVQQLVARDERKWYDQNVPNLP